VVHHFSSPGRLLLPSLDVRRPSSDIFEIDQPEKGIAYGSHSY
jgi:hypothetical protein